MVQAPDRHIDARTRGNGEIERRDAAELKALQGKEAIYWLDRVDPSNCLVEREGEYQAEPKRGNVMKRMSLGCSFDRHVLKQRRNATFAFTSRARPRTVNARRANDRRDARGTGRCLCSTRRGPG